MDISVNYWGVLLAGVSSMIIGAAYYAPAVFGAQWMKLGKINEKKYKKDLPRLLPIMFLSALVAAYVVAYIMFLYHNYFGGAWVDSGAVVALILWLGVSATTVIVHNALDQRPTQLTYITLVNRLLSLLAMGLILGWLHP